MTFNLKLLDARSYFFCTATHTHSLEGTLDARYCFQWGASHMWHGGSVTTQPLRVITDLNWLDWGVNRVVNLLAPTQPPDLCLRLRNEEGCIWKLFKRGQGNILLYPKGNQSCQWHSNQTLGHVHQAQWGKISLKMQDKIVHALFFKSTYRTVNLGTDTKYIQYVARVGFKPTTLMLTAPCSNPLSISLHHNL